MINVHRITIVYWTTVGYCIVHRIQVIGCRSMYIDLYSMLAWSPPPVASGPPQMTYDQTIRFPKQDLQEEMLVITVLGNRPTYECVKSTTRRQVFMLYDYISIYRERCACDQIYKFGYTSRSHMGTFKLHICSTQAMISLQCSPYMDHSKDI